MNISLLPEYEKKFAVYNNVIIVHSVKSKISFGEFNKLFKGVLPIDQKRNIVKGEE